MEEHPIMSLSAKCVWDCTKNTRMFGLAQQTLVSNGSLD